MGTFADADVARLRIALARIARQLERQAAGDGLTHTELTVLGLVCRTDPIGVSELADRAGINPTMLSRVIAKLQDQALVKRLADPADGRAARVRATAAGRRCHDRIRDRRTRLLSRHLTELDDAESLRLLRALPVLESLVEKLALPTGAGVPR